MSEGGIIIALAGQATPANRRAFGMGIFQIVFFFFACLAYSLFAKICKKVIANIEAN